MNTIENQIESLVDSILLDYQNHRDIDKLDLKRHPDKDVVIDMIAKQRKAKSLRSRRSKLRIRQSLTIRSVSARYTLSCTATDGAKSCPEADTPKRLMM